MGMPLLAIRLGAREQSHLPCAGEHRHVPRGMISCARDESHFHVRGMKRPSVGWLAFPQAASPAPDYSTTYLSSQSLVVGCLPEIVSGIQFEQKAN
jgi:hypothetical protein